MLTVFSCTLNVNCRHYCEYINIVNDINEINTNNYDNDIVKININIIIDKGNNLNSRITKKYKTILKQ